MIEQRWWHRLVELTVTTACVVGVLLALASHPSGDELWKGLATALVAFVISQITTRMYGK